MPIVVSIPRVNIWDIEEGVQKILTATRRSVTYPERLVLDFAGCSFLSAEAAALIASIFLERTRRGHDTHLDIGGADLDVRRYLQQIGLLKLCGVEAKGGSAGSSLPLRLMNRLDKEQVLSYVDQEIMDRDEMPAMTVPLKKEIRRAFFEVIGNIFYHSGSPVGAIVCGQIYPKINEVQIIFLDRGVGVARKVRSCVEAIGDDVKAIEWALQQGTSTLSTGTLSRGLGLYLLREFVRVNGGQFRMYANSAFFEEGPAIHGRRSMALPLQGTLIDLRIKIRQDVEYGFIEDFQS